MLWEFAENHAGEAAICAAAAAVFYSGLQLAIPATVRSGGKSALGWIGVGCVRELVAWLLRDAVRLPSSLPFRWGEPSRSSDVGRARRALARLRAGI